MLTKTGSTHNSVYNLKKDNEPGPEILHFKLVKKEGTRVEFKIKQRSRKNLQELFNKFSPEDENFEFNKNEMRVRLRSSLELISRSQARRLLAGLDDFKTITFDFKDIPGIGQAFADEIFRVYPSMNPEKKVNYENAGPVVKFMIERALSEK